MVKTVSVGNREYDAVTGLPLSDTNGGSVSHISRRTLRASKRLSQSKKSVTPHDIRPAAKVHNKTQKSTTLNRSYIKMPAHVASLKKAPVAEVAPEQVAPVAAITHRTKRRIDGIRAPKRAMPVRSTAAPHIAAKAPVAIAQPKLHTVDTPAQPHPIAKKAHDKQALRKHDIKRSEQRSVAPPASVIKQAVVNESLKNAPKHHAKQLRLGFRKQTKIMSFVFGCMALMLMGGYLTYINAPNISVRVAAAQAGIDASYPGYHPDGYSLHGPVAFNKGEVSMSFVANANKEVSYMLEQSRSNWDSRALLDNYVKSQSNGSYSTSQIKGMTIYTYNGNAAWVSGGILYTISGNATLSPEQVRKIATSLS